MTREEVIRALANCVHGRNIPCRDKGCPYFENADCQADLMEDAIRFLGEQDRESEIVTVVDKYHIYNGDDLMESFYGFIHTEVEWFLGRDATYAESSMHHIAGAVSLLQTILNSGESLVRKEKADA